MLTNMMQWLLDQSAGLADSLGDSLGGLMLSPFRRFVEVTLDSQVIGMLNWVFPMTEAVAVMELWVGCITSYYVFTRIKSMWQKKNLLG